MGRTLANGRERAIGAAKSAVRRSPRMEGTAARVLGARPLASPFDGPAPVVPARRTILIAATPRSGSTLLARGLAAQGIGQPREWLSKTVLAAASDHVGLPAPTASERWRRRRDRVLLRPSWAALNDIEPSTLRAYVDHIVAATSVDGVFAAKLFWGYLDRARSQWGLDLDWFPGDVTWIRLRRRDRLWQAASWVKANSSGVWLVPAGENPPLARGAAYDDEAMLYAYGLIRDGDREWDDFFAAEQAVPIEVDYEDLSSDYVATMGALLDRLGEGDPVVRPPQLVQQRDVTNATYVATFARLHPEIAEFEGHDASPTTNGVGPDSRSGPASRDIGDVL